MEDPLLTEAGGRRLTLKAQVERIQSRWQQVDRVMRQDPHHPSQVITTTPRTWRMGYQWMIIKEYKKLLKDLGSDQSKSMAAWFRRGGVAAGSIEADELYSAIMRYRMLLTYGWITLLRRGLEALADFSPETTLANVAFMWVDQIAFALSRIEVAQVSTFVFARGAHEAVLSTVLEVVTPLQVEFLIWAQRANVEIVVALTKLRHLTRTKDAVKSVVDDGATQVPGLRESLGAGSGDVLTKSLTLMPFPAPNDWLRPVNVFYLTAANTLMVSHWAGSPTAPLIMMAARRMRQLLRLLHGVVPARLFRSLRQVMTLAKKINQLAKTDRLRIVMAWWAKEHPVSELSPQNVTTQ